MHQHLQSRISKRFPEAIETILRLSSQNSGSSNLVGLDDVAASIEALFSPLGVVSRVPLPTFTVVSDIGEEAEIATGNLIDISSFDQTSDQVLLVSHYDTVFGLDHAFQDPIQVDDRLIGPGVADAKGGIAMLWLALTALKELSVPVNWRLIIVPDEEIGSPSSAPLLRAAARAADHGLGFEPSLPDGSMAAVRPGSGTFTVRVSGLATHAGRALYEGRNAVLAAGELLRTVEELNQHPDVLANPAFIKGGGPTNIVPDLALVRFNVRPTTSEARDWALREIEQAVNAIDDRDGYSAALWGGFNRAPKPMTPEYRSLLDHISSTAATLGMAIGSADTGGVCDGNVMYEAGLVNVDNLGPTGGNLHAAGEYLELTGFEQKTTLIATLLSQYGKK